PWFTHLLAINNQAGHLRLAQRGRNGCGRLINLLRKLAGVLELVQERCDRDFSAGFRGTDSMFGISAIGLSPSREPRASAAPPPATERKTLFEPAPVGLRPDRKTMPRSTGFEIRIAHRACQPSERFWGVFGEYL